MKRSNLTIPLAALATLAACGSTGDTHTPTTYSAEYVASVKAERAAITRTTPTVAAAISVARTTTTTFSVASFMKDFCVKTYPNDVSAQLKCQYPPSDTERLADETAKQTEAIKEETKAIKDGQWAAYTRCVAEGRLGCTAPR